MPDVIWVMKINTMKRFLYIFGPVLAVVILLLMAAAPPAPVYRNAWTTNAGAGPVHGTSDLQVTNANDVIWNFFSGSTSTVARIYDVTAATNNNLVNQFTTNFPGQPVYDTVKVQGLNASQPLLTIANFAANKSFQVDSNSWSGSTNITGAWAAVPYVIFRQTVPVVITNVTAPTSIFGVGAGSRTISGGVLRSNSLIELEYWGEAKIFAGANLTNVFTVGGTMVTSNANSMGANTVGLGAFRGRVVLNVLSTNAAWGFQELAYWRGWDSSTISSDWIGMTNMIPTVNFAIDQALDITLSPNNVTNSYTIRTARITVTP